MARPIIKSGAFACDGTARLIPIGFRPDVVFAKLGTGSTPWMWWTPTSWCHRTQRVGGQDSFFAGIHGVTAACDLMLGVDAQANVSGQTLYWFAMADNGSGRWRLYINGRLVKQRNIDMAGVTLTDDAGTRSNAGAGTGHTTMFGARWSGSAAGNLARMTMCGASVYGSELTPAQARQMWRRNFLADTSQADITPVERWLADDASGTSWPATISAANNGTISASAGVVLRDAWATAL